MSSGPAASATAASASPEELQKPPETVPMTPAISPEEQEELNAAKDGERDGSDSSKLKTLMGILKRMIGVKDMAAIRLSLPANLLEPVPNLEYWNYLDRGDIFASIGELEDPLDRMLQTLRFAFTKELKFVHGKVCKPYNSILGEHFRCHWDIQGLQANPEGDLVPIQNVNTKAPSPLPLAASTPLSATNSKSSRRDNSGSSRPASIRGNSTASTNAGATGTSPSQATDAPETKKKGPGLSRFMSRDKVPKGSSSNNAPSGASTLAAPSSAGGSSKNSLKSPVLSASIPENETASTLGMEQLSLGSTSNDSGVKGGSKRICFITEQVSHHPPISSFFVECKETGVQLCGVDQLSAKFTGTSVRVFPGDRNKGIFVKLTEDSPLGSAVVGEEYQITHPTASINGLLRGSLWVAICDTLYITCRGGTRPGESEDGKSKRRLRSIIEYKDESWLLKAKYALEGVIYEYDYDAATSRGDGSESDPAEEYKTIKEVPQDRVVATFEGTWRGKITWKRKGEKESRLLINLEEIEPLPKTVRPLDSQEPMESRKIWQTVTSSIHQRDFSAATRHKQRIEQVQRDAAAERKRQGTDFVPKFFEADLDDGRPRLTAAGRKAVNAERNLEGYRDGENVPETDKDIARRAAVGNESDGGVAATGERGRGQDDDGDDDDDDDDGGSFRSAED